MSEKTTIWILLALIAYVLFKDKLFGEGGISGSFSAGTTKGGPSPSGNTYANTSPYPTYQPPPPPPSGTNVWDVIDTGIRTAGDAYETYRSSRH
jgi:hypothetical protein